MYTSIALLALSGTWLANLPTTPTWEFDYHSARQIVEKAHKPLALFLGRGDANWRQLTREGQPDADIAKLLTEQYVRVYVNVETAEGRKTAEAFGLSGTRGLVISDRSGELQAFRHDGDLSAQDLARHLTRFGSPDHLVVTTETNAPIAAPVPVQAPAPSYYQPPTMNHFAPCRT